MMNNLHPYWQLLEQSFGLKADPRVAAGAKAYMRNQFDFFGIKAPDRRLLMATFKSKQGTPDSASLYATIQSAWEHPCREMQYAAMEVLLSSKKKYTTETIQLIEYMIINKSWWDTVDYIAPNILAHYFKSFPENKLQILEEWMSSDQLWLQRSCLLFQLKAKNQTDAALLFDFCKRLASHPDFFIRKAIGWALRTYARVKPQEVLRFVDEVHLSPLSRREALKHFQS